MNNTLLFLTCVLFVLPRLNADDSLSLSVATTEAEQKEMGLNQLNDQQKAALEKWLGSWTKKVIQTASTYHPSLTLNQWVKSWPVYLQPNTQKDDEEAQKEEKKDLTTIHRNINGEKLILNNGSEWKIVDSDRFNTRFWVRDTPIEIKENKLDTTRPYILYNRALNDQAGAVKLKEASKSHEDPPGYFKGSFQVKTLSPGGKEIVLMNNSSFKISPVDQLLVTTTWKVNDRIRVENSNDVMYPYKLNNLDSGSVVQGIKK